MNQFLNYKACDQSCETILNHVDYNNYLLQDDICREAQTMSSTDHQNAMKACCCFVVDQSLGGDAVHGWMVISSYHEINSSRWF
jgi:hypothetical protein